MTSPNWGLAGNNALAMFGQGAQLGQQVRQSHEQSEFRKQQLELQKQNAERQQAEFAAEQEGRATRQQEALRAKAAQMAKFLAHARDEQTFQQARSAAGQYFGAEALANVPAQFDPNWVGQQRLIAEAVAKDGGQALSTAGKQAMDMGYEPGTPEFTQAVRDIWTAGESKPYVVGGETRLYQPKIGGAGQAVGSPPPEAVNELRQNPASAAQFDEIFGPGASARVLGQGGGGGNVTSNFLDGIELRPGE